MPATVHRTVAMEFVVRTKGRSTSMTYRASPLALPMGEMDERSEIGEGDQRSEPAVPSQSPAVTALPKGEPSYEKRSISVLIYFMSCYAAMNRDVIDPVDERLPGFILPSVDFCDYL